MQNYLNRPVRLNGKYRGVFVTDLDGTLFTDEKSINERDLKALERLKDEGVIRLFATGRSIMSLQRAVEKIGFDPTCSDLPVDYVIFSTGAGIMDCRTGSIIKKHSLNSFDVDTISTYFDKLKLDYMIHREIPDTSYCIYREQGDEPNPDFRARIEMYRKFSTAIKSRNCIEKFGSATELLAIVPSGKGHDIADTVQVDLQEFSVIRATSPLDGSSVWIEVFNRDVSKSKAVTWLCEMLGIERSDTWSIGNDYNDLDLLEWSANAFVVSNAPSIIRSSFCTVSSNNECGVSEAIGLIFDNRNI